MKTLPLADQSPVITKTLELCQTILDQPAYARMKEDILAFLANEEAKGLYEKLCNAQEELHQRHHAGESVSDDEMTQFEELEQAFLAMPEAAAFVQAQRQMHKIEQTVSGYVRKTFELGRVPSESDVSGGGCGSGCGCSH